METRFNKIHGPSSESSYAFISRTYEGIVERICRPERKVYSSSDLKIKTDDIMHEQGITNCPFEIHEEYISLDPKFPFSTIKICFWENKNIKKTSSRSDYSYDYDNNLTKSDEIGCILYLHTNTRNCLSATEVLPLCNGLNLSAITFDLPGHGNTHTKDEIMSTELSLACIDYLIEYAKNYYKISYFILWARGMSTALAIEYCGKIKDTTSHFRPHLPTSSSSWSLFKSKTSNENHCNNNQNKLKQQLSFSQNISQNSTSDQQPSSLKPISSVQDIPNTTQSFKSVSSTLSSSSLNTHDHLWRNNNIIHTNYHYHNNLQYVKCLILDTPFVSIQSIVDDAIKTIQAQGYPIPKFIFDFAINIMKSSVSKKLGFDPYLIKPIHFVPNLYLPILILVATKDDYIQPHHTHTIMTHCNPALVPTPQVVYVDGSHFSERYKEMEKSSSQDSLSESLLPRIKGFLQDFCCH